MSTNGDWAQQSETLSEVYEFELVSYWRVSEASETLSGVTQLKIGYICLNVHMSFLYFDPGVIVFVRWSTPSQTSLNGILWFIDHYLYHPRNWIVYCFEFFCGCSWNLKTYLSSISIRISGGGNRMPLCHGYKPYATVFTWKFIVH